MITLNDYLYSGDTVLRILKKYIADLRISAVQKHNEVDLVHCNFLIQIMKLLEQLKSNGLVRVMDNFFTHASLYNTVDRTIAERKEEENK